jgi:hypothetical protein
MKGFGILMRVNGPNNKVIKIRPPFKSIKENVKGKRIYIQKSIGKRFYENRLTSYSYS